MRLSAECIDTIKTTIHAVDSNARIYLFGSRADDCKAGGDIDLLVLSSTITLADKLAILVKIKNVIGEQKIDMLVAKDEHESTFVQHAFNTGVAL